MVCGVWCVVCGVGWCWVCGGVGWWCVVVCGGVGWCVVVCGVGWWCVSCVMLCMCHVVSCHLMSGLSYIHFDDKFFHVCVSRHVTLKQAMSRHVMCQIMSCAIMSKLCVMSCHECDMCSRTMPSLCHVISRMCHAIPYNAMYGSCSVCVM